MKSALLLSFFILVIHSQTCPQDICESIGGVKTGCRIPAAGGGNQNNLQGCLSGFTCSAEVNTCVLIDPLRLQRPGENCYQNSDCVTNYCVLGCQSGEQCQQNNTCQTQLSTWNCTSDIQCPANNRCLQPKGSTSATNTKCLPLSAAGSNCNDPQNNTWCTWGTACASTDDGQTYTCIQAFSVAARSKLKLYGTSTGGTVDTMDHLCSYGYYNISNNTCAIEAQQVVNYPKECRTLTDCPLNWYNGGNNPCICSTINQNGLGFCQPTDQDSGYLGKLRNSFGLTFSQCAPWQMAYRENGCFRDLDAMNVDISTTAAVKDYNCYVKAGLWPFSSFDSLLTPPSTNQGVCPNYTCNNYNTYFNLENGACIVYNQGSYPHTYNIYNCPNGYYCQATVGSQSSTNTQYSYCLLISHFPRYPGDDCMNNQECYTGHCVAGVCIVQNSTNTCASSFECGRGLYCKSGSCQAIIPEGGACSTSNYTDCIEGTVCLQQNGNNNYYCRYYFSQSGGQKFSIILGGTSLSTPSSGQKPLFDIMCSSASYNTSNNNCNNDPERTNGGWTKQCSTNQDCIGTYLTQGTCACYPNTDLNKQYCAGFQVEYDPCFSNEHGWAQRNLYGCYPFEYNLQGACGVDSRCNTNNPVPSGQRGSCYSAVFGNSYLSGKGGNGALLTANFFAMKFTMLILGMILIFILI